MDLYAASDGYSWSSPFYISQTITALIVGGVLGLVIGWFLDATVLSSESRRQLLTAFWSLLVIGIFLFMLLRPAFQGVRE